MTEDVPNSVSDGPAYVITLDYRLALVLSDHEVRRRLVDANKSDLHYVCLPGDITFRIGVVDFSTNWGWVPIADFVLVMNSIVRELQSGSPARFEFTESDAYIDFRTTELGVEVSASYVDESQIAVLPAIEVAVDELTNRLVSEFPELMRNDEFVSGLDSDRS